LARKARKQNDCLSPTFCGSLRWIFIEIIENYAPVTFARNSDMTRKEIRKAKGKGIYLSSNLLPQKR